mgnify:CR=1 FL=1
MPYGPHTDDDRARMLATLGIGSVDELFADIPAPLRASPLDLPPPEPELELAARLAGLAARNRTDLTSFLGAGVQPPTPSWGTMINEGVGRIVTAPYLAVVPGAMLVFTVLSLNIFGDGVRDALDPRAKVRIDH